ncbi:MAG: DNA gyrase subunit A, partial [Bdellovibrionales bacterium]|nr:DNA gyrase subunit A [Bdellovibrionales bacterium]
IFGKQERERLVITELPYQVNKSRLIEKIAEMVNNKVLTGISDIRDESNRLGIRICIELKKGEIASVILNRLFKNSQLQVSFGIIFLAIVNGIPKVLNIKEQLLHFIDHRREIVIRRTVFELEKARQRAHILEGLKKAVENIDPIIELIKKSDGPVQARTSLVAMFTLSEIQAQAILDMKLQRLTGLERDKIISDYEAIIKEIIRLEGILNDDCQVRTIIKDEFTDLIEKYGDERRTEIIGQTDEIDQEDLIKKEEVIVTVTHKGYVKRMLLDTYKTQKRGGVGVKGASMGDDFVNDLFVASTHDTILFFTSKGVVFSMKVYQIPEATRTARGRHMANLLPISSDESVKEVIPIPVDHFERYLVFSTKKGLVKRSQLSDYQNIRQNGLRAIKIQDGDSLVNIRVTDGTKDVLLCSSSGKIIRFNESDCRVMGRVSQGVKGIALDNQEKIIGMELIDDGVEILSVTEKGYGKRTQAIQYRKQGRGGRGILAMKLTEKNGDIVQIKPVNDKDDLMIITNKGQVIRVKISGISLLGRNTQGVKLINLKGEERVVAVEKIIENEEEE